MRFMPIAYYIVQHLRNHSDFISCSIYICKQGMCHVNTIEYKRYEYLKNRESYAQVDDDAEEASV
jgi:hypothetical protein